MATGWTRVRGVLVRRHVLAPTAAVLLLATVSCAPPPEIISAPSPTTTVPKTAAQPSSTVQPPKSPGGGTTCAYPRAGEPAKPVDPPPAEQVATSGEIAFTLNTNEGPVVLTLDRAKAPCAVNSFESLATQGFFDKTRCHRLVDGGLFLLQCGDPTGTGTGGPGYSFADEVPTTKPDSTGTINYAGGTVAMANAGPNTNGSQFFLVYADSPLPPNYTIFGSLDEKSRGIVARIAAEGQDGTSPGGGGKPNNPAEITSVTAG